MRRIGLRKYTSLAKRWKRRFIFLTFDSTVHNFSINHTIFVHAFHFPTSVDDNSIIYFLYLSLAFIPVYLIFIYSVSFGSNAITSMNLTRFPLAPLKGISFLHYSYSSLVCLLFNYLFSSSLEDRVRSDPLLLKHQIEGRAILSVKVYNNLSIHRMQNNKM